MTAAFSSMAEATATIGSQFTKRTNEISLLTDEDGSADQKQIRNVIKLACYDMERYSEAMELQVKITSKSREEAFDALNKALAVYVDFKDAGEEDKLVVLEKSLEDIRDATKSTIVGLSEFKETVSNLPRLTIDLNKSKRRVIKVLNTVLEEMNTTKHSAKDVLSIICELENN